MKLRIYLLGNFIYWLYHHTPLEKLFMLYYYSEANSDGKYIGDFIEVMKNRRSIVDLIDDRYYQEYWS